jgi:hypothetical protein
MLESKIHGSSRVEIAEEFNVSVSTVDKEFSWAKKAGLIASAEDKILAELVPLAHEAIREALINGDAEVALKIFEGTIPGFKKSNSKSHSEGTIDELSEYLNRIRSNPSGDPKRLEASVEAEEKEIIDILPNE